MIKQLFSKGLMAVLSFLLISPCFALQIKPINENSAVKAEISTNELTRIAIDQDRIVRVRGLEGAYDMKSDSVQGAIFIRPSADYQAKPFTLFLATEQNHNYVLHLTPKDKTADTILLKPKGVKNEKATHWENSSPYTKTLAVLTTAMITDAKPSGYAVDAVSHTKRHHITNHITAQLIRVYSGAHLRGYVYLVKNSSNQTCTLTEQAFYQKGDRSIALSNLVIAPKGEVLLYKVRSYE